LPISLIRLARRGGLAVTLGIAVAASACRQDMHDQPKYTALEHVNFIGDTSAPRLPVEGTVARGHLRDDTHFYTGKIDDEPVAEFPFPVDARVMTRGQEMFNAFCSPCHGRTGEGDGPIVRRGFSPPPSLIEDRLREVPAGHIFDVITNGFGAMPDHASQIRPADRWAIVAYVRALQTSAAGSITDVPAADRSRLEAQAQ
jgi:mono/diheme cytochrome c family protein